MNLDKLLVKTILRNAVNLGRGWTVQGLGMLRLYLDDSTRLHVWNSRFIIPGVSPLHTHPWAFDSIVVAGTVRQRRYTEKICTEYIQSFNRAQITCGANAKIEQQDKVWLSELPEEVFNEGQSYRQWAEEIHRSYPEDGTVTLVTRHFQADREHAYVYWQGENGFVSAEPRNATPEEIQVFCTVALAKYF